MSQMWLICFVSAVTRNKNSLGHADTVLPSAVFLLFLLTNGIVPGLDSSEPSAELLLITRSSSFFLITSAAAATSSSSSSSWSEYWLKASTSSLKISSLIKPPSETEIIPTHMFLTGLRGKKNATDLIPEWTVQRYKRGTQWYNIHRTPLSPWTPS